jgi:hypothetical protein
MMQQQLRAAPSIRKKAKSVYSQRSLGTIKDRKREKKEEKEVSNGEVMMRILRMRYVRLIPTSMRSSHIGPDPVHKTSSLSSCRFKRRCKRSRRHAPSRRQSAAVASADQEIARRPYLPYPRSRNDVVPDSHGYPSLLAFLLYAASAAACCSLHVDFGHFIGISIPPMRMVSTVPRGQVSSSRLAWTARLSSRGSHCSRSP